MKLFSINSPLFKFFDRLWDLIKLNFFWLICSLPIVTLGASTAAAFTITNKMVLDHEGYIVKPFFKAFKENLKKGIPLGLMFEFALYAFYILIQININAEKYEGLLLAFTIILGAGLFCCFIYAFSLLARYENGIFRTIANSFHISLRYFGRTLLLAFILAILIGLFMWNVTLMAIGSLIAPACVMLAISGFSMKIFKEIEKQPGAVSNPEALEENYEEKDDAN